MKEYRLTNRLVGMALAGIRLTVLSLGLAVLANQSQAGENKPFFGAFHGYAEAPTDTSDPEVKQIVVPLTGVATELGRFDELLVHYLNVNTLAFTGYTEWTAANGDKLYTTFAGQAYPTADFPWLTFDVTHIITGGTGRFAQATGTFIGVNGRFNLATGEDLGGYVGTISF